MYKAAYIVVFGILLYYYYNSYIKYPTKLPSELDQSYDFVIVGAGSAGAAVAARLSEDPTVSVLLLEAGSQGRAVPWSHIPGLPFLTQDTSIDWKFATEPQKHACLGLKNKVSLWPRGKVLGGTSVINYMLHVRGSPDDYNYWADELGCSEWSFQSVLPYFKKLETASFGDPEYRGQGGPMNAVLIPETKYIKAFLKAAAAEGYAVQDDYNGFNEKGFSRLQMSTRKGWRCSTFSEYLFPRRNQKNLHVVTDAMVTKVNVNEEHVVTGVSYLHDGNKYTIKASKEVVLSAGAVQSPQLLMLSGIGPKDHLESLKIPVHVDLPSVGKHLKDHLMLPLPFTDNKSTRLPVTNWISFSTTKSAFQWLLKGTGPLSWPQVGVHALLESGLEPKLPKGLPDIQFYLGEVLASELLAGKFSSLRTGGKKSEADSGDSMVKPVIIFGVEILQPKSSGEIRLRTSDPFDPPVINPNYLSDIRDIRVLVKGVKIALDLTKTEEMQRFALETPQVHTPGCERHQLWSDDYLICLIRHRALSAYHPTSTCRMGPNKTTAVVDTRLKVFGVKKLRVADASVFPDILSGNTNVPSIMIGERAADFIKEDWKQ